MIMSPAQIKKFQEGGAASPYVAGIQKTETSMDPIVQQMLYGLDGQGGFIPGAMRAAERSFFDEQGRPLVTPRRLLGLAQINRQPLSWQEMLLVLKSLFSRLLKMRISRALVPWVKGSRLSLLLSGSRFKSCSVAQAYLSFKLSEV